MAIELGARSVVICIALFAVAGSGAGLYLALGGRSGDAATVSTLMPAPVVTNAAAPPGAQTGKGVPTMVEAADRLSRRLERQGGSAEDWTLLARTYVELKQYPEATKAFMRALEKSPNDLALKKESEAVRAAAGAPPAPQ